MTPMEASAYPIWKCRFKPSIESLSENVRERKRRALEKQLREYTWNGKPHRDFYGWLEHFCTSCANEEVSIEIAQKAILTAAVEENIRVNIIGSVTHLTLPNILHWLLKQFGDWHKVTAKITTLRQLKLREHQSLQWFQNEWFTQYYEIQKREEWRSRARSTQHCFAERYTAHHYIALFANAVMEAEEKLYWDILKKEPSTINELKKVIEDHMIKRPSTKKAEEFSYGIYSRFSTECRRGRDYKNSWKRNGNRRYNDSSQSNNRSNDNRSNQQSNQPAQQRTSEHSSYRDNNRRDNNQRNGNSRPNSSRDYNSKTDKCFNCGKTGHQLRNCREPRKQRFHNSNRNGNQRYQSGNKRRERISAIDHDTDDENDAENTTWQSSDDDIRSGDDRQNDSRSDDNAEESNDRIDQFADDDLEKVTMITDQNGASSKYLCTWDDSDDEVQTTAPRQATPNIRPRRVITGAPLLANRTGRRTVWNRRIETQPPQSLSINISIHSSTNMDQQLGKPAYPDLPPISEEATPQKAKAKPSPTPPPDLESLTPPSINKQSRTSIRASDKLKDFLATPPKESTTNSDEDEGEEESSSDEELPVPQPVSPPPPVTTPTYSKVTKFGRPIKQKPASPKIDIPNSSNQWTPVSPPGAKIIRKRRKPIRKYRHTPLPKLTTEGSPESTAQEESSDDSASDSGWGSITSDYWNITPSLNRQKISSTVTANRPPDIYESDEAEDDNIIIAAICTDASALKQKKKKKKRCQQCRGPCKPNYEICRTCKYKQRHKNRVQHNRNLQHKLNLLPASKKCYWCDQDYQRGICIHTSECPRFTDNICYCRERNGHRLRDCANPRDREGHRIHLLPHGYRIEPTAEELKALNKREGRRHYERSRRGRRKEGKPENRDFNRASRRHDKASKRSQKASNSQAPPPALPPINEVPPLISEATNIQTSKPVMGSANAPRRTEDMLSRAEELWTLLEAFNKQIAEVELRIRTLQQLTHPSAYELERIKKIVDRTEIELDELICQLKDDAKNEAKNEDRSHRPNAYVYADDFVFT